ncbi:manganese transport protein [Tessaracoccus bendigoensis DSM 12906]|uniref:Manganese transport protein n=1 Tax=Tessaracoccus bendigoensis DSM 12906 TaxID=1123357 RepID=A0A1M6I5C7_9ACTN|nr:Nramp family divalent metal transporter [Tessaracoccus bendigoensis]SHJ29629.1 manganese transport protein [Tessaracoccus bendigoensis DSM 12906]
MQRRTIALLGPAFVAALAYVDPGNVAANLSAGAEYGYLLVWALVLACLMAMLVQYLSAKLGVVSGRSLSELIREDLNGRKHRKLWRVGYAAQAVAVAVATDLAEVVGGAIALNLLFGLPMWLGAIIVGGIAIASLNWMRQRGEHFFEVLMAAVLAVIAIGFLATLFWLPPDPAATLNGLLPRFADAGSVQLAAAMLGATVMPHAIYLHSALAKDRHATSGETVNRLLKVQRIDVAVALTIAAAVNVSMLLFAASGLRGSSIDSIEGAYKEIGQLVGALPATVFAVGLLVSGIGSAIVGTDAGAGMVHDFVSPRITATVRRLVTLVPAVGVLVAGLHATQALVQSQLVLSFGIAFALVPLAMLTSSRRVMGVHRSPPWLAALAWMVVGAVVALNVAVLVTA